MGHYVFISWLDVLTEAQSGLPGFQIRCLYRIQDLGGRVWRGMHPAFLGL